MDCSRTVNKQIVSQLNRAAKGLVALLFTSVGMAHAATVEQRELAIYNATTLMNAMHGVAPTLFRVAAEKIADGTVKRPAPNYPVWIMEADTGTILYYQGQPGFTNQSAGRLLDDKGRRFGVAALERARKSKGLWQTLELGGRNFDTYCHSRAPIVVCNLIP